MWIFLAIFTVSFLSGDCCNTNSVVHLDNICDSENVIFEKRGLGFKSEIVLPQGDVVTSNIDNL